MGLPGRHRRRLADIRAVVVVAHGEEAGDGAVPTAFPKASRFAWEGKSMISPVITTCCAPARAAAASRPASRSSGVTPSQRKKAMRSSP